MSRLFIYLSFFLSLFLILSYPFYLSLRISIFDDVTVGKNRRKQRLDGTTMRKSMHASAHVYESMPNDRSFVGNRGKDPWILLL